MSYAIRNDGLGWRAVESAADCGPDETWQEEQPAPITPTAEPEVSPVDKLKAFLAANPDVAALM